MAKEIRLKCTPDSVGAPTTWHYWRETQTTIDATIECGDHPLSGNADAVYEHFIIEGDNL